jgi:hypothetical protein
VSGGSGVGGGTTPRFHSRQLKEIGEVVEPLTRNFTNDRIPELFSFVARDYFHSEINDDVLSGMLPAEFFPDQATF